MRPSFLRDQKSTLGALRRWLKVHDDAGDTHENFARKEGNAKGQVGSEGREGFWHGTLQCCLGGLRLGGLKIKATTTISSSLRR